MTVETGEGQGASPILKDFQQRFQGGELAEEVTGTTFLIDASTHAAVLKAFNIVLDPNTGSVSIPRGGTYENHPYVRAQRIASDYFEYLGRAESGGILDHATNWL